MFFLLRISLSQSSRTETTEILSITEDNMSKVGQKEAVVAEVLLQLPTFQKYVDNALLKLSSQQLEDVKANVMNGILNGNIEYSKDPNNHAEVRTYARSMVMNHFKKAKELNGGCSYVSPNAGSSNPTPRTVRVKEKIAPKGVNPDLLPQELKDFAKTLV
jgi:hypothetical protein